ncbi:MAG: DNA polymerase III subunit beta [Acidobacteria bacterium]|nr:DNA polymerase III subunit beta [Acidobacteriota bacterium]
MLITVEKSEFLKELQLIQTVAERKSTIPILSNVLLETVGDKIKLAATDLEVGSSSLVPAKVEKEGSLTVSARLLYDIVRQLPEAPMKLEQVDSFLSITCGGAQFKLVALSKEDFPSFPSYDFEKGLKIEADLLKNMIIKTAFAATEEESRFALNGALTTISLGEMKMVATDAHRLAIFSVELPELAPSSEIKVIVPKKALYEMKNTISDGGDVVLGVSENQFFLKAKERMIFSRLIEGQFPNYERVIPKDSDKKAIVPREDLVGALRRVSLLANERSRGVRLFLEKGKLEISSANPERGEAKEELAVDYNGDSITIGFNAQYLLDFLNVIDEDKVIVELKNESTQGLFYPAGETGYKYLYIVMPMRI